ncbi:MAG: DMT family transporter [Alphaproteobacteria bacterium]
MPKNVHAALWISLGGFLLVCMSSLIKELGEELHTFQIVFIRSLFGMFFILPVMLNHGLASFKTQRPLLHCVRVCLGMITMYCVFYTLIHMALAEAVAIVFSRPLFVLLLAIPLLGEVIGWRRATATAVGFLGVLVMVKPGTPDFEPVALVAVIGAMFAGSVIIAIKKLSATDSVRCIVFWFSAGGTLISLIPAMIVWQMPSAEAWFMLIAVGGFGVTGQIASTRGFSLGEASAVAAFDYLRLIYAGIFGIILFAEIPDTSALTGAAIIVASTLYIARREIKVAAGRNQRQVPEPPGTST